MNRHRRIFTDRRNDARSFPSKLWRYINQRQLRDDRLRDITDFRGFKVSDINARIAFWSPATNGMRYCKTLLYNLASSLSARALGILAKTKNMKVGNPVTVTYDGVEVCLDYVQAALELEFIEQYVSLDNRNVLEVGAGYGRTCHVLMANHSIKNYCIVDLKNCLTLAYKYLKQVLSEKRFKRITRYKR